MAFTSVSTMKNKHILEHTVTKVSLLFIFVLIGLAIVFSYGHTVKADRISDLQSQIDESERIAAEIRARGNTLQNELNAITAEKNGLQAEINLNQAKYDKLTADIAANEVKLERQKQTLSKTIAQIYANGNTTPIEMLASSKNVGQYVAEQGVRNAVRDQLKTAMDSIKQLKAELAKQKKDVEDVLAQQNAQKEQLAAKEAQQAELVAQTRGEEAAYGARINDLKSQKAAAEAALAASLMSGSFEVAAVGPVSAGTIIGAVGSTGMSTGPHLHLEMRNSGGSVVNPSPYIRSQPVNQPPAWVSQTFGNEDPIYASGRHPGIDYAASTGTPIHAIDNGMLYRGCSQEMFGTWAYGYVAMVVHASGMRSIYGHMNGGGC